MSVRLKLYATVVILSAFAAITGAIGLVSLNQYQDKAEKLKSAVKLVDELQEQRVQFHQLNRDLYSFLGTGDEKYATFVFLKVNNLESDLNQLVKNTEFSESRANLVVAIQNLEELKQKVYKTMKAFRQDDYTTAKNEISDINNLITLMSNRLANSSLLIENKSASLYEESQGAHEQYSRILILAIIIIITLGIVLGYILVRGITLATKELHNAAMEFAGGDRHRRINKHMSGEFAVLCSSFNHMANQIQQSELRIRQWSDELEKEVTARTRELKEANQNIENLYIETVAALVEAIEAKDSYTRGHSENVAKYALAIGNKMDLTDSEIEELQIAALLHDIGKIGIREEVLNKPTKLNDLEYRHIKQHPGIAYQIIGRIPGIERVAKIVLHHHERYDGQGYPEGLKGDEIPLGARILAVADTFDAMSSNRSYRNALPLDAIKQELLRNSGIQFDPGILGVFIELFDSLDFKSSLPESPYANSSYA